MTKRAEIREKFINAIVALGKPTVTTDEIKEICSKVDIAHPVNALARFMTTANSELYVLAKGVLRYLKGVKSRKIS